MRMQLYGHESSIIQAAGESPAVCPLFQSCANRIFAAPRIHALGGFFFEVCVSVESEIIWMRVLVQFAREHLTILGTR